MSCYYLIRLHSDDLDYIVNKIEENMDPTSGLVFIYPYSPKLKGRVSNVNVRGRIVWGEYVTLRKHGRHDVVVGTSTGVNLRVLQEALQAFFRQTTVLSLNGLTNKIDDSEESEDEEDEEDEDEEDEESEDDEDEESEDEEDWVEDETDEEWMDDDDD
jgi:hypothetical protein